MAALGDALAEAVVLSQQASQGRAEPDAGTTAAIVLSVIAVLGVLVYARYRQGDIPDPVIEPQKRKTEPSGRPNEPIERKWSDITPWSTRRSGSPVATASGRSSLTTTCP